jgi:hypothetical protein
MPILSVNFFAVDLYLATPKSFWQLSAWNSNGISLDSFTIRFSIISSFTRFAYVKDVRV